MAKRNRPGNLWNALLNLLFPPRCIFCQALLPEERYGTFCCARCAEALPCTDSDSVSRKGEAFSYCLSPFFYQEPVSDSIRRYKFHRKQYYHKGYGPYLRRCLEDYLPEPPDLITWAPLSRRRLGHRGYDQARQLAEEAARQYGLRPMRLLVKTRNTQAQSGLTAKARLRNAENVYVCIADDLKGKRILLVDDVLTTGATLNACAAELLEAGAKEVIGLTLARSRTGASS